MQTKNNFKQTYSLKLFVLLFSQGGNLDFWYHQKGFYNIDNRTDSNGLNIQAFRNGSLVGT